MQGYRNAKPHNPTKCPECAPNRPGHNLCQHDGCDEIAETQHRRHATQVEYDALPEHFKPIDGIAHQAVFTCLDHEADPICESGDHDNPAGPGSVYFIQSPDVLDTKGLEVLKTAATNQGTCPTCGVAPESLCVKANGKPRSAPHEARTPDVKTVPIPVCTHVHREDCGGQDACHCTPDDPAPVREPRIIPPPVPAAPAPIHVPTHGEVQDFLADNGIDVTRVLTLELVPSADGPIVLRAVLAVLDHHGNHVFDQHGQRQAEVREIRLTPTHPTDPAVLP